MSTEDQPFNISNAIGNYRLDTIYQSQFKRQTGKFFNLVIEENGTLSIEYEPPFPIRNRLLISISFIKEHNDIREITVRRFIERKSKGIPRWEEQSFTPDDPIRLTHFSFEKLVAFLGLISEQNLANIDTRRLAINADNLPRLDGTIQSSLRALLSLPDGATILETLLKTEAITTHDIINIGYRKAQLRLFRSFLDDQQALLAYGESLGIKAPEKIWQHYLKTNPWIFGFGLDYQFL
jgi:hypothetical protein